MEKFSSFQSALESWAQLTQMNIQIQKHNNNNNNDMRLIYEKSVTGMGGGCFTNGALIIA